jgi:hypothetical protein
MLLFYISDLAHYFQFEQLKSHVDYIIYQIRFMIHTLKINFIFQYIFFVLGYNPS